ncbi:unnamed protein product [Symbiodinium sp. CCMP2592]|nr:unnamed protein product [Symbiodinium sp. CCMP2592]
MGSAASAHKGAIASSSAEDLKETVAGFSEDERKKILEALASIESGASAPSLEAIAGSYTAHASDGDWGEYSIVVKVNKDASMTIATSACFFRDSPETCTKEEGTGTLDGDILVFTSSQLTESQEGTGAKEASTTTKTSKSTFRVQPDGALAKLDADGAVAKIQGGYGGEPQPAILARQS